MKIVLKVIGFAFCFAVLTLSVTSKPLAQTNSAPTISQLTDQAVCRRAMNADRDGWVEGSDYTEEAGRRGITFRACSEMIAQPPSVTTRKAKSLPLCDDYEVRKTLGALVNLVRDWLDVSEYGSEPNANAKRMCYAYFYGQTGRTSSAFQEAIFSLEWINEAEGRWWLQIRTRQTNYKGPTNAQTKQ